MAGYKIITAAHCNGKELQFGHIPCWYVAKLIKIDQIDWYVALLIWPKYHLMQAFFLKKCVSMSQIL